MTACLFLGGPVDGQFKLVNTNLSTYQINARGKDPKTVERHLYRRMIFTGEDQRKHFVYKWTGDALDAIQALLEGYARWQLKAWSLEQQLEGK